MKSDKLYGGGTNTGKNFHFEGVSFIVRKQTHDLILLAMAGSTKVLDLKIETLTLEYKMVFTPKEVIKHFEVDHLYVIEHLLKSYSLSFGFCLTQLILELYIPILNREEKVSSGKLTRMNSEA